MAVNRWVRLVAVGFSCIICAGLIPGQSLFIEIFVSAGVGAFSCADAARKIGCPKQYELVSASFNIGGYVSMIGLLIGGVLYDRYGGRWTGIVGAFIVTVGMLLVSIPVWGAAYGYDDSTASVLPLALLLTDMGSMLQSYCLVSLLQYFSDFPTLLMSMMTGTYFAGGIAPNVFEHVMDRTGCSLLQALSGFTSLMVVSAILCMIFVPTQEEVRAQAKVATGLSLPKVPKECTCWKDLRKSHSVLKVHFVDHVYFTIGTAVPYAFISFYTGFLGDYGRLILDSVKAEKALPEMNTMMSTLMGAAVAPIFGAVADKSRNSQNFLTALILITSFTGTGTVLGSTWLSQQICVASTALFQAFFQTVCTVRCINICLPTALGTVFGVFFTYLSAVSFAILGVIYVITDKLRDEELPMVMFFSSAVGSLAILISALRTCIKGQPSGPVILADDENELSQLLGCQNFKQVLYVTHTEDSPEGLSTLLKRLTSGDPRVIQELLTSVDTDRVDELAMASSTINDIEELAVALREGKDIKSGVVPVEPRAFTRPDVTQYQMTREGRSLADAMTTCTLSCASQLAGSDVVSRTVTCNMMPPSRLCLSMCNNESFGNGFTCEPLLSNFQKSPFAGDAVPSLEDLKGRNPEAARNLNRRLLDAVQAGQKDAVLSIYEKEDPKLLLEAYQDLLDNVLPNKDALMKFEKDADNLVPEEEMQQLIKRRPVLASMFVKFTACRMKKNLLS